MRNQKSLLSVWGDRGPGRRSAWLCALLGMLLSTGMAWAQPSEPKDEMVRLSLERYGRLLRVAASQGAGRVSWGRGSVSARVVESGRAVEVRIDARFQVVGAVPAEVPLLPADVALLDAQIDGAEIALLRVNGLHTALVEQPGARTVRLRYIVPTSTDPDGRRSVLMPLPALPGSALSLSGFDGETTLWPQAVGEGGALAVPATPAVLLTWGRSESAEAVRRVSYVLRPEPEGDGADVDARIEVQIEGRRIWVRVAQASTALVEAREKQAPLPVRVREGWHEVAVEGRGRHEVDVRLRAAVDRTHGQPQIELHPDNAPIAQVEITVDGAREVTFEPPAPQRRELRGAGDRSTTVVTAHLPPTESVRIRWTEARAAPELQVRYNTETYQLLSLHEGVLRARVITRFEVVNGKLRELPIALPDGVLPARVLGEGIEDWRVYPATDDAPRQLRVMLGQELEGRVEIEVQFDTVVRTEEGAPLDPLPVLRPVAPFYQVGVIALFDGDRVGFGPATVEGLNPAGQDALPPEIRQSLKDKVSQAFRHVGPPGTISSKVIATPTREARFDARADTLYTVRDGSIMAQAVVIIEVKSGRRDRVILSLPESVAEPRVTGPSLNKVEPAGKDVIAGEGRKAYEVRFTQALEGAIQLDVEFELLLRKELGDVALPDLRVHEAEVQAGSMGVSAETGMEVKQSGEPKDLRRVPVEELPRAVRLRSALDLRLGYQYVHSPWSVNLDVRRHKTVETLNAVAAQVFLETNILENGHIVNRAIYRVVNEDRQFVRLTLPAEASVLRVMAGAERTKAVVDDAGAIAIPLPKNRTVDVVIDYETIGDRPGLFGAVTATAPQADLRASDLHWTLRYPARLTIWGLASELSESAPSGYSGQDGQPLARDRDMREVYLSLSVRDASEGPLVITARFATAPGDWADTALWLLAVLCLALVVRARAAGRAAGRQMPLLLVGVAALVLKAAAYGLGGGEALVAALILVVVGVVARRGRSGAPPAVAS